MKRLKRSDLAWCALALGVVLYDVTAPEGETLSEACDRYLERRPTLTRIAVMVVARHLLNDVDPRFDPLALLFVGVKALNRPRVAVLVDVDVHGDGHLTSTTNDASSISDSVMTRPSG